MGERKLKMYIQGNEVVKDIADLQSNNDLEEVTIGKHKETALYVQIDLKDYSVSSEEITLIEVYDEEANIGVAGQSKSFDRRRYDSYLDDKHNLVGEFLGQNSHIEVDGKVIFYVRDRVSKLTKKECLYVSYNLKHSMQIEVNYRNNVVIQGIKSDLERVMQYIESESINRVGYNITFVTMNNRSGGDLSVSEKSLKQLFCDKELGMKRITGISYEEVVEELCKYFREDVESVLR